MTNIFVVITVACLTLAEFETTLFVLAVMIVLSCIYYQAIVLQSRIDRVKGLVNLTSH